MRLNSSKENRGTETKFPKRDYTDHCATGLTALNVSLDEICFNSISLIFWAGTESKQVKGDGFML